MDPDIEELIVDTAKALIRSRKVFNSHEGQSHADVDRGDDERAKLKKRVEVLTRIQTDLMELL